MYSVWYADCPWRSSPLTWSSRAPKPDGAYLRVLISLFIITLMLQAVQGEAPLLVYNPKELRQKIVSDAERYMGAPYKLGGADGQGFDCSGLVWRVYKDICGISVPRTSRSLGETIEEVSFAKLQAGDLLFFDTTAKYSHVGIYVGEGDFIHSASDGLRTGVIRSSLSEQYWRSTWSASGRLINPAASLGVQASMGGGWSFDPSLAFRGVDVYVTGLLPSGDLRVGSSVEAMWDAGLGVLRLPVTLTVGWGKQLQLSFGPSLTIGEPRISALGDVRLQADSGLLGHVVLSYSPYTLSLLDQKLAVRFSCIWDHYDAVVGTSPRVRPEGLKFGIYIEERFLI